MSKIYIVTGALGHLGSTIFRILKKHGCNVRGLDLAGNDTAAEHGIDPSLIYRGDICDYDSLKEIFTFGPEDEAIVFHSAGIISIDGSSGDKMRFVNVYGTKNIIRKCLECKVKRMVYVSSVHAIPEAAGGAQISEVSSFDPDLVEGMYAKTKAEATQCVMDAIKEGLDAVIVQPSGIIGPNDTGNSHTNQIISEYLNGKLTACVKGGYDFVDVRDVALATINAAIRGRRGECYILSNRHVEIIEILDELKKISGRRRAGILPYWFAEAAVPLAELYYKLCRKPPLFTKYSLFTLRANSNFNNSKARKELGFRPRSIKATIHDTVASLLKSGRIKKDRRLISAKLKAAGSVC